MIVTRPAASPGERLLLLRVDRGVGGSRTRCVTARRRPATQPARATAGDSSSSSSSSGEQQPPRTDAWGSSLSRRRPSGGGGGAGAPVGGSLFGSSSAQRKQQQGGQEQQQQPPQQQQQQQSSSPAVAAAAAEAEPPPDPALAASIRASVERAAATLDDIVREVLDELLLEEASAYLLDEGEEDEGEGEGGSSSSSSSSSRRQQERHTAELRAAARGAVVKRLEWLDANFLAALNAALSTPTARATPELGALLGAVRAEVLDLVGARLPPAVRVLNAALQHARRAGRRDVVAAALAGGRGDLPGAALDELGAAAAQLVDDMEEQQVVANRALLARLVLLREELRERAAAEEAGASFLAAAAAAGTAGAAGGAAPNAPGAGATFFGFHRANLPARCAAFAKSLLASSDRAQRLGLLTKAFQEDWLAERPPPPPPQTMGPADAAAADGAAAAGGEAGTPAQRGKRSGLRDVRLPPADEDQQQQEAPDAVRPGRFLATLAAMRHELEGRLVEAGLQDAQGADTLALLRRLEDVRLESLAALDRLQHGLTAGGGGGGDGGDGGGLDYELELQAHEKACAGVGGGAGGSA